MALCVRSLGVFKKKIWNLNNLTLFSHYIAMWEVPKKCKTSQTSGMPPTGTPQNGSDPFISEKQARLGVPHSEIQVELY